MGDTLFAVLVDAGTMRIVPTRASIESSVEKASLCDADSGPLAQETAGMGLRQQAVDQLLPEFARNSNMGSRFFD